ncbi:MAG: NADH-quinone oxidoreductase subunit NuoF [Chloroflexi bacterium]|nr:NADH-quinone oxidoreductase subunit NuoF [Chloroflexota bacterium]
MTTPMDKHVLLRDEDVQDIRELAVYQANEGYAGWKKAVTSMKGEEVIGVVKDSGLRGRGGAGFPAGLKWSFIPKDINPKYVTVNCDESEPGTFKDHQLIRNNPHQVIEGTALCCYAIGAHVAYIYCRGEFKEPVQNLQKAIDDAYAAGLLGKNLFGTDYSLDVYVHLGAGAYICGEESALIESLEGKIGQPRLKPPFPAVSGLYNKPTVINNVETLANVPGIVLNGSAWYRQWGTEKSPGVKIFSVSGHVKKPDNYELPLGKYSIQDLLEMAGGSSTGLPIKAVLPAGSSSPIIPAVNFHAKLDYESMGTIGSVLGSCSWIFMDESVDMVWAARKMIRFFKHESCGKCTPCREGTHWALKLYDKMLSGEATMADVDMITTVNKQISGKCFCPLGEFSTSSMTFTLKHFRKDYEDFIAQGKGGSAAYRRELERDHHMHELHGQAKAHS